MSDEETAVSALRGEVFDDFPQLREKAVVDVVNSLEVVGDNLRWRDENPSSFLGRVVGGLTGASERRQQSIDRGIQVGLNGISDWLHTLQAAQAESDIALERIAERMLETRQAVMRLQSRHQDLQDEVKALSESTERSLSKVHKELARGRAYESVTSVRERWRRKRYDGFPPLLRTVLAANDLYWGHFGAFLRLNGSDVRDAEELVGHARDTLGNLADDFVNSAQANPDVIIVEHWLEPLETSMLPVDWREAAAYLLEGAPRDVQPLAAAASIRLQGAKDALPENLPRLIQPPHLGELALRETVRRIESEQRVKEDVSP